MQYKGGAEMEIQCQKESYQRLFAVQKRIFIFSIIAVVLGFALGVLLFFLLYETQFIAAIIFIVFWAGAGVAAAVLLMSKFYSNCKKICKLYKETYGVPDTYANVAYLSDNFDLHNKIKIEQNQPLMAWKKDDNLYFVALDFIHIEKCRGIGSQFKHCVNADFGMLIISENEIVHYSYSRNITQLITQDEESVKKIVFDKYCGICFFDSEIPAKKV